MTLSVDRIGVCSWSLGPSSPEELVEKLGAIGVKSVQCILDLNKIFNP